MKARQFLLILIASGCMCTNTYAQLDYSWSLGFSYSHFEYDMGYKELFELPRYKESSGNQGRAFNIEASIPIGGFLVFETGLTYAHQNYKYWHSTATETCPDGTVKIIFNNLYENSLDYFHLPLLLDVSLRLNQGNSLGLNLGIGILNSYCSSYKREGKLFEKYLDASSGITSEYLLWNFIDTPKGLFVTYYDQQGNVTSEREANRDFWFRRFNVGVMAKFGFFAVISERNKLQASFFYNQDFLSSERKDHIGWAVDSVDGKKSKNKRIGVNFGVHYLFD